MLLSIVGSALCQTTPSTNSSLGGSNPQCLYWPQEAGKTVTWPSPDTTALAAYTNCGQIAASPQCTTLCLTYNSINDACRCVCQQNAVNCGKNPGAITAAPAPTPSPSSSSCLRGDDTVQLESGKQISIAELAAQHRSSDVRVLAWDAGTGKVDYSPVFYWLHADPNQEALFYEFELANGQRLSMTDKHVAQVDHCGSGALVRHLFAEKVRVGQCMRVATASHGTTEQQTVVAIRQLRLQGIYAPLTGTGSLMVNGVGVSCHSMFENVGLQNRVFGYVRVLMQLMPHKLADLVFDLSATAMPSVVSKGLELLAPRFLS